MLRFGDRLEQLPSPVQALIVIVSLTALLEIGAGCGAYNQNAPNTPPNPGGPVTVQEALTKKGYVSGTVKRVEASDLTLDLISGDSQVLTLTPKTIYYRGGKVISLAEINLGEEVWIKTKESKKSGGLVVQKVLSGAQGELPVR